MRVKVRVKADSTPEELAQLQALGCAEKPYLTFPSYVVYAATMSQETADEARSLECVMSVEKMPTYSVR